jgi:hypothetical protein
MEMAEQRRRSRKTSGVRARDQVLVTDFGYALAVSRVEGASCKTTLVAPPNRLLGSMTVSLRTKQARTTLHDVDGSPTAEFRWHGEVDLEIANRSLEAQHRSSMPPPPSSPAPHSAYWSIPPSDSTPAAGSEPPLEEDSVD